MKKSWMIAVVMGIAVLLAACGGGSSSAGSDVPPEIAAIGNPENGRMLFNSGGASGVPCATCHTLDGTPLVGPSLKDIPEIAEDRIDGLSAEEYLRQSIVSPSSYLVEGYSDAMNKDYPAQLSQQEINDIIAFLLSQ